MNAELMTAATPIVPKGGEAETCLTHRELAAFLRVSERLVSYEVAAGRIQPIYIGRRAIYSASEINRYLSARQAEAAAKRANGSARRTVRRQASIEMVGVPA